MGEDCYNVRNNNYLQMCIEYNMQNLRKNVLIFAQVFKYKVFLCAFAYSLSFNLCMSF